MHLEELPLSELKLDLGFVVNTTVGYRDVSMGGVRESLLVLSNLQESRSKSQPGYKRVGQSSSCDLFFSSNSWPNGQSPPPRWKVSRHITGGLYKICILSIDFPTEEAVERLIEFIYFSASIYSLILFSLCTCYIRVEFIIFLSLFVV